MLSSRVARVLNALDRLEGWQLLAVLAPIALVMWVVRRREERRDSIAWETLNSLQRGWLFLSFLTPGLGAALLHGLRAEDRERLFEAGRKLQGSPGRVAPLVLDTFCEAAALKDAPRKDPDETARWLQLRFEEEPGELLSRFQKVYF